jgi:hypothetical protein
MTDWILIFLLLIGYLVLTQWLLPRLGIPT